MSAAAKAAPVPARPARRVRAARDPAVRTADAAAIAAAALAPPVTTAALFELLADATRRRLLVLLLDEREVCVCRLVDALHQPQPKVSRHLAVLRDAGVLVARRQRTWIMYRLNPQLPGWAVRVISMMSEGARHEPEYADDCSRLARARVCGEPGFL
jgi:ArsR family transcriptional regulator, arsenate/arsenite/antimonite-responsive transcriptional repressor